MRGDACTSRCGFCGACEGDTVDSVFEDQPVFCTECDRLLGPSDYKLTMAPGTFCSTACADKSQAKFSRWLERKQRQRRSA